MRMGSWKGSIFTDLSCTSRGNSSEYIRDGRNNGAQEIVERDKNVWEGERPLIVDFPLKIYKSCCMQ